MANLNRGVGLGNALKQKVDPTTRTDLIYTVKNGALSTLLSDYLDTIEEDVLDAKTKANEAKTAVDNHLTNTSNPHSVTKAQVGLSNVDNTSDLDKPISTATQSALDDKANQDDLTAHTSNNSNPHSVTKAQVGLGNVDNTSDLDKPISTATQTALDTIDGKVDTHINSTLNPHSVTKAQVGLGNVDNTSDLDKPISTATQTALNNKADKSSFDSHIENTSNPHNVTKAQVGLSNVDNTSDVNKPVSTPQKTYIDNAVEAIDTKIDTHTSDTTNPHNVTKAQVGLSNVDNTSDMSKPLSTAQKTYIDDAIDGITGDITDHIENTNNPHSVTKAQVGLGNVDNTSDANKPVSTAQKTYIDDSVQAVSDELDLTTTALESHIESTDNPHNVTKAQIGLENVTNDAQVKRSEMGVASGVATLGADGKIVSSQLPPVTISDTRVFDNEADMLAWDCQVGDVAIRSDLSKTFILRATPASTLSNWQEMLSPAAPVQSVQGRTGAVVISKADLSLENVDNTSDLNKPISTATQTALDNKVDKSSTANQVYGTSNASAQTTYTIDKSATANTVAQRGTNGVLKVGNPSADGDAINLKYFNENIGTATQEAIDDASGGIIEDFDELKTSVTNHLANTSNPHSVTKAQVGLGNVDNTSDLDKPISTATQTALTNLGDEIDGVDSKVDTHIGNTSNPHNVTKTQVGLGNVDNTSDLNKPISTDTQSALDLKQDILTAGTNIDITNNVISTSTSKVIIRTWS